jgi:hypothetical protein
LYTAVWLSEFVAEAVFAGVFAVALRAVSAVATAVGTAALSAALPPSWARFAAAALPDRPGGVGAGLALPLPGLAKRIKLRLPLT